MYEVVSAGFVLAICLCIAGDICVHATDCCQIACCMIIEGLLTQYSVCTYEWLAPLMPPIPHLFACFVSIAAKPSFTAGPPGPKPWDLILKIQAPIFIAWGDTDPFTPLDGPVGIYMRDLATTRPNTTFALLKDVGHCPQDDRPELLHTELLPWLEKLMSSCSPQQLGPGAATGVVTVAAGSMQSGPNGGSLQ